MMIIMISLILFFELGDGSGVCLTQDYTYFDDYADILIIN